MVQRLDLFRRDNLQTLNVCHTYLEQYKSAAASKSKELEKFIRNFDAQFEQLKNLSGGQFVELDVEEIVEKK